MIDSKRILFFETSSWYIYLLQLSAQLSASRAGMGNWLEYLQPYVRLTAKSLFLFCCCAELSKSVVVRLTAALPLATPQPQRTAEEHQVYPLHQAGAGVLPLLVSPHEHPGNRNLSSGKPRGPGFQHMFRCAGALAGQLSGIAAAAATVAAIHNLPPRHNLRTHPHLHSPRCWASLSDFST